MSDFPKVANIVIGDNLYDIHDNTSKETLMQEMDRTEAADVILENNKALLAAAISEKGVITFPDDTLIKMAENIMELNPGDAPAMGNLIQDTSRYNEVNMSVSYYYPWVERNFVNGGIRQEDGSGCVYYTTLENVHDNVKFITRWKVIDASGLASREFPVMYCGYLNNGIDLHMYSRLLKMRIFGEYYEYDMSSYFDDTFNLDLYFKVELQYLDESQGDTRLQCTISVATVDLDGKPEDYYVILRRIVSYTTESMTDYSVRISFLGLPRDYVNDAVTTDISGGSDGNVFNYANYLKESCIVGDVDDAGIYKVVAGSSSIYPYNR